LDAALAAGERGTDGPLVLAGAAHIVVESGLDRIGSLAEQVSAGDFKVEAGRLYEVGPGAGKEPGGLTVDAAGGDLREDDPGVGAGLVLVGREAEDVASLESIPLSRAGIWAGSIGL
jgi:hypothetical protein